MCDFIDNSIYRLYDILRDLFSLPAPSHQEQKRADYCKQYLERAGAKNVYIDDALNVIFPYQCDGSDSITVFSAHTDTVFPDTEDIAYFEDEYTIRFPGAGDNSASVAVLLLMAEFFVKRNIVTENGILFVFNSCEEGLGNLKGTRELFSQYGKRIKQFIAFDSVLDTAHDKCVGSCRYSVEVRTKGGHSYYDFGENNAICLLSEVVGEIYKIKVPEKAGTKTTYNVGTISGGTSVNSVAQSAQMLCEYRSDDMECLSYMKNQFEDIFAAFRRKGVDIDVQLIGERPCGNADEQKMQQLKNEVVPIIEHTIEKELVFTSASTDCNIPLSFGIPALCIGVSDYSGMHTQEECLFKNSLKKGLSIAIELGLELTKASK